MKRILRSTLDPLPRSLSTPALVTLVMGVVLGTAVTVHRYIQSSGSTQHNVYASDENVRPSYGEVRAAAPALRTTPHSQARSVGKYCESRTGTATGCTSTAVQAAPPASTSTSASAFRPLSDTSGG